MTASQKAHVINQAFRAAAKRYIDKYENEKATHVLSVMNASQIDGDFFRAMLFDAIMEESGKYAD